jgi:hypothetical protein
MMIFFFILTVYQHNFKYHHQENILSEDDGTGKKHLKKQVHLKEQPKRKTKSIEKRQRYYAFGFLVGEY